MSDDGFDFVPEMPDLDEELLPIIPLDHDTGMMTMRPYQQEAVDAVFSDLQEHRSTLAVLATGLGKTIIFAEVAYRWPVGRVLIVAHREELIEQAQEKVGHHLDERPAIEMGSRKESRHGHGLLDKSKVLVTSVQTMSRPNRMQFFNPMDFGLVIVDECFVAGTLVDGVPIQNIAEGHSVFSFNHTTETVEQKPVLHLFRSRPSQLVALTFDDGSKTVCTPGHPYYIPDWREYVDAKYLEGYCVMRCVTHNHKGINHGNQSEGVRCLRSGVHSSQLEQLDDSVLFGAMQTGAEGRAKESRSLAVSEVPNSGDMRRYSRAGDGSKETGILLRSMPRRHRFSDEFRDDGEDEQKTLLGTYEEEEPDAQSYLEREGENNTSRNGVEAACSWWKRAWTNCCSVASRVISWVGYGVRCPHRPLSGRQWLPDGIQDRHRESSHEDCNRSRWSFTRSVVAQESGPEKDCVSSIARVVRVEVLEPGSDGRFGGLCPDGFVYNIEVEDNNNYFADGILVHNCHHSTSASYRRVLEHFHTNPQLRHLGVTATPKRADEAALGDIYQSVAYEMDIRAGIDEGWLVDVEQRFVVIEGLDFSEVRTTAGDFNQKDLAGVMMGSLQAERLMAEESPVHKIVSATIQEAQGRPTIIFCVTKAHAELTCEICQRHPGVTAEFVTDDTDAETRREIIKRFRAGTTQIFCNVGIATEGFDARVDVVAVARPTKSEALYRQMIGRGTRPLAGLVDKYDTAPERREAIANSVKAAMTVLDFVGASGRHTLISAVDVLGGNYTEDIIEAAKRRLRESGETADIDELLAEEALAAAERKAKAQKLAQEQKERDAAAKIRAEEERLKRQAEWNTRKGIRGHATYRTETVSAFERVTIPEQVGLGIHRGGCSDGQVKFLMRLGVTEQEACKYSKGQAGVVIDKLSKQTGGDYIMPFTKHMGRKLRDIPSGYLDWAEKNISDPKIQAEIKRFRSEGHILAAVTVLTEGTTLSDEPTPF